MKLCNLVNIEENSKECVLLKVKDNVKMDLIKLGCFDGNEEYIRLTKGKNHTCTVFKREGDSFNEWHWGTDGYTLVSPKLDDQRKLIEGCITDDFDIYIGDNLNNINKTLFVRSLEDVKDVEHFVKFMYWNKDKKEDICVHKDEEYYRHFSNIEEAKKHFKDLGFYIQKQSDYIADTGCIVEEYFIDKKNELELETITNIADLNEKDSFTVARAINKEHCVELHYCSDYGGAIVEYGVKVDDETWEDEVEKADWFNKNMTDNEVLNKLEELFNDYFYNDYETKEEDNEVCSML